MRPLRGLYIHTPEEEGNQSICMQRMAQRKSSEIWWVALAWSQDVSSSESDNTGSRTGVSILAAGRSTLLPRKELMCFALVYSLQDLVWVSGTGWWWGAVKGDYRERKIWTRCDLITTDLFRLSLGITNAITHVKSTSKRRWGTGWSGAGVGRGACWALTDIEWIRPENRFQHQIIYRCDSYMQYVMFCACLARRQLPPRLSETVDVTALHPWHQPEMFIQSKKSGFVTDKMTLSAIRKPTFFFFSHICSVLQDIIAIICLTRPSK